AGSPCTMGAQCAGGTCYGAPGQPQAGNPRFTGGYCTSTSCTPDTQNGCGPDEWCEDSGDGAHGYCVAMCSRAEGLSCERDNYVCLGLGNFGGCFSEDSVECNVVDRTGCKPAELCVRVGFDERELGRCMTACDLLAPQCPSNQACYFIRTYSAAFCAAPGSGTEGSPCSCDKCCVPGLSCTPDGTARTCGRSCLVK